MILEALYFLVVRFQIGSVIKELDVLYPLSYLHFQRVKSVGWSFALFMEPRSRANVLGYYWGICG
jgi:hypothetical protein